MSLPLSILTGGLTPSTSLVTGGLASSGILPAPPTPTPLERPVSLIQGPTPLALGTNWEQNANPVLLYNPSGAVSVPVPGGYVDLGSGHSLEFDPDTLRGRIPALRNTRSAARSGPVATIRIYCRNAACRRDKQLRNQRVGHSNRRQK